MDQCIPRMQLYEEVWATPIGELAVKYDLSRSDIVRLCTDHQIPRPAKGHWTRKRYGFEDAPTPLPGLEQTELEVVCLKRSPKRPSATAPATRQAVDDEINRLIQEELSTPAVAVPSHLRRPHGLVQAIAGNTPRRESSGEWKSRYATLTAGTWRRALCVMDALLKALESRGHTVYDLLDTGALEAHVEILDQSFNIRIHEPTRMQSHLLTREERERKARYGSDWAPKHDYVPTGELSLQLTRDDFSMPSFELRDRTKVKVEDRLKRFIITALKEVDRLREIRARRAEEDAAKQRAAEAERQEEARQQELAAEQERLAGEVQAITDQVQRWRRAQDIRSYVQEVRALAEARGESLEPGSHLDKWIDWALSMADRIDPVTKLRIRREAVAVAPEPDSREDG